MTTTAAPAPKLRFEKEKHLYLLEPWELRLPSVTEVLRSMGIIRPEYYTAISRARGRAVHEACYLLDMGRLIWESLIPIEQRLGEPITQYVRGWERFKRETQFIPTVLEQPLWHPSYLYAGTPDREGEWPHIPRVLLDIKTGEAENWVGLQTGGYDELIAARGESQWRKRVAVRLTPNGDYKVKVCDNPSDGATFLSMVNSHRWKMENGYWKGDDHG